MVYGKAVGWRLSGWRGVGRWVAMAMTLFRLRGTRSQVARNQRVERWLLAAVVGVNKSFSAGFGGWSLVLWYKPCYLVLRRYTDGA
jgi:hypothetical protein